MDVKYEGKDNSFFEIKGVKSLKEQWILRLFCRKRMLVRFFFHRKSYAQAVM